MNILAVRFARLGDVILLLPALSQLKATFPESRLTFLTGHRCAPVAGMCPAIDDVISVNRVAMRDGPFLKAISTMACLVREIRGRRFDLVIDFHGFRETNLLTWFSGASQRLGLRRFNQSFLPFCFNLPYVEEDKGLHVSQMFASVVERLGGKRSSGPVLVVPEEDREWVRKVALPDYSRSPLVVLYVDAPTPERIWSAGRFAAVADHMIEKFGAVVAVIGGPDSDNLTRRVRDAACHPERIQTFSGVSIPRVAALIEYSRILVSNDTGPMHFGPALGVPTLGLFSIGLPEHFRPTGIHDCFLKGNPIDRVTVPDVVRAAEQMWVTAADRDPQR